MSGIRKATVADLDLARAWLSQAKLPQADLTPAHMQHFLVAMDGDAPVGIVGMEVYGDAALLRSLVVADTHRRSGTGSALVAALENRAAGAGVKELWLLTTDAEKYFGRLGFTVRDRADAPASIRNTKEFSVLCPGDAVLMCKA